jgi:hypothetical protein
VFSQGDSANDVLNLEVEASGTQFAANQTSKDAFGTFFNGSAWMIYRNIKTNVGWVIVRCKLVLNQLPGVTLGLREITFSTNQ